MVEPLRVVDFGRVSPLRSQTLWHAVGYGVSAGRPATLSFARPSGPYVCLGYHRDLAEVDREYCRRHGLPVYRRMVGGGPVYLDQRQLFFQICVPARSVPPSRVAALRDLLYPAATAFRAAGLDARLEDAGEICVGDRKVCGHGAGQIEDAVVVCGNLIEAFDHERATRVLGLADPAHEAETLRLMRRYVAATPADPDAFALALTAAYAGALRLSPVPGELDGRELDALAKLDRQFNDDDWLAGPARHSVPGRPGLPGRQVKVRSGVWTFAARTEAGARIVASVVNGTLDRVALSALLWNGEAHAAERAMTGLRVRGAAEVLGRLGEPGREFAAALVRAEGRV